MRRRAVGAAGGVAGGVAAVVLLLALAGGSAAQAGAASGPAQDAEMEGLTTSVVGPLDDPAAEARATSLASELRCPVCQGLSIHDSPSPLAQQMKDLIRSQVASGWSDAEIRDYFVSKYGEWVLLEPRATGFNLLVYLLPALMLLGGAAVIFIAVRRWTGPAPDQATQRP